MDFFFFFFNDTTLFHPSIIINDMLPSALEHGVHLGLGNLRQSQTQHSRFLPSQPPERRLAAGLTLETRIKDWRVFTFSTK